LTNPYSPLSQEIDELHEKLGKPDYKLDKNMVYRTKEEV